MAKKGKTFIKEKTDDGKADTSKIMIYPGRYDMVMSMAKHSVKRAKNRKRLKPIC